MKHSISDSVIVPAREFHGRESELRVVREAVRSGSATVAISGRRGMGKTALAYRVFAEQRDRGYEFASTLSISAHSANWDTLVDSLYRALAPNSVIPRRPQDVESAFVSVATKERILVFIDNLEPECIESAEFDRFMTNWTGAEHRSTILVTTREWRRTNAVRCTAIALQGIRERSAVLAILGGALRLLFDEPTLLDAAAALDNVPQKLIYLGWLQPTTVADLAWAARGLAAVSPNESSVTALRKVLALLPACGDALVALGLLRAIEFSTSLFEYLCHTVSGADSQAFDAATKAMLNSRILLQATTRENDYRIHPDVHLDLRRLAEERGRPWMHDIHVAAVQYYIQRLDGSLALRDHAVFHYAELQEYDLAYDCVINDHLARWHNEGLALQLSPIVQELFERRDVYSALRQAAIMIELAHIASDLSRHRDCIRHLREAMALLDGLGDEAVVTNLRRRVWMLLAASNGDLGDNSNCIYYYLRAIESDPDVLDTQTALCMGYLGYQYCDLMDFERAEQWSTLALSSCAAARDVGIFAKNLCNRALVLYYGGHSTQARTHLEEAVKLLTDPQLGAGDIRELGRVLSYLGLIYIGERDVPLAVVSATLMESVALTGRAGDARRRAMSWGRLGVVAYIEGDLRNALDKLTEAAREHYVLGDYRNLAFELMALSDVTARGFTHVRAEGVRQLVAAAIATGAIPPDVEELIRSIEGGTYGYLLDFWFSCQRARLFARIPSDGMEG